MNYIKIVGMGEKLPVRTTEFNGMTRYRISNNETQISMAVDAVQEALEDASLTINQIDVIVSACSFGSQPIPNMSALIHEQIAKGSSVPCLDINTTCTSFISALDTLSYMIQAGRYKNVLIVSSEVPSLALNPEQRKSFELFSDCAVAMVISKDNHKESYVKFASQKTYSEGAHDTEIKGGGTAFLPNMYTGENDHMYQFDMKGKRAIRLTKDKIIPFVNDLRKSVDNEIDYVVPHQASLVLDNLMKRIGFTNSEYISIVKSHGNMVSASVPFAFKLAVDKGLIKRGDNVLLIGTAAGLHINGLVLKY